MNGAGDSSDKLSEPIAHSESVKKEHFSATGWNFYIRTVIEYQNLLYLETRTQAMARAGHDFVVQYSRSDVRKATLKLALREAGGGKARRRWCQVAAMIASLMTGICGNWAFSQIPANSDMLPWLILLVCACIAVAAGVLSIELE